MKVRILLLLFLTSAFLAGSVQAGAGSAPAISADNSLVYLPVIYNQTGAPILGDCNIFQADNLWNTPIESLPVDGHSMPYISKIGAGSHVHADFGSGLWEGGPIGIPYVVVPENQAMVTIDYMAYGDESDTGPFPIPANAPIEGGAASDGDRHVLVLQQGVCILYELYRAFPQPD